MAEFKVSYVHKVEITYDAVVEAETEEEAIEKMYNFDLVTEEEIDRAGIDIDIIGVEEIL